MSESPDIHALIEHCSLITIGFLTLTATRADEEASTVEVMDAFGDDGVDISPEFELSTGKDEENQRFRIRVKTTIDATPGHIFVDVVAEYDLHDLQVETISREVMLDFANRVGLMALIPYIRQGIADLTQRVFNVPLTMPVYKAGDMHFTDN